MSEPRRSGGPTPGVGAAELLRLREVAPGRFESVHNLDSGIGAIFGGQPMVQGLAAASRTVAGGWPAHSYTGHFLRAGDPSIPVEYAVEATRTGRRFASRRVEAMQGGRAIFDMLCAFHDPEAGPEHQFGARPMPPPPEEMQSLQDFLTENEEVVSTRLVEVFRTAFPIELRLPEPMKVFTERAERPERSFWFRMASPVTTEDPREHQQLLAFMSDFWFAGTAAITHKAPCEPNLFGVLTLNHSLWFHAPVRADDWFLYQTDSPWAGQGRGLVRGTIYDRTGLLIASAVQELTLRAR